MSDNMKNENNDDSAKQRVALGKVAGLSISVEAVVREHLKSTKKVVDDHEELPKDGAAQDDGSQGDEDDEVKK